MAPKKKSTIDSTALESNDAIENEYRELFPLTADAFETWKEKGSVGTPVLRVTSKRGPYWRGEILHTAKTEEHLMYGLTPHQVEAILEDPDLVAEVVSRDDPAPEPEPTSA